MASKSSDHSEKQDLVPDGDDTSYPSLKVLLPAMFSIYLAMFLVALDRTIIGTAIPTISADFNSFGDIAWYEAGFLLPLCVLQLTFGRIYKYYSTKWVLFTLVSIFEIGSIVCAAAPNSNALIVGRTITGIGGAGTSSGAMLLITRLVPLQSRPKWMGGIGAVFGISSILGPIVGGYLTSVTWRWCFWINVPIGGVSLLLLLFLCPNKPSPDRPAANWRDKIDQLDPVGFILLAPSVICLLFALELGGNKYPWNSGTIIALFVIFAVFGTAFIAAQFWRGEKATIPFRIVRQRSVAAGCLANTGIGSVLVILPFYLPIWFQVIQGKSPQSSGLSLLGFLLSNVIAVVSSGILTSKLGYYTPLMICGGCFLVVGTSLITTWNPNIEPDKWIGYQIVTGIGLGLVLQQPPIAAQTVLSDSDISIGLSILQFVNFLGGTIFITVAQTVFQNTLLKRVQGILPGLDAKQLGSSAAGSLRDLVSTAQLPKLLGIYNDSMRVIWYECIGLSCVILLASLGFEWKSVKSSHSK